MTPTDYVYVGSGILALAAFWLIMRVLLTCFKELSPGGNLWKQGDAYRLTEQRNNDQMQRFREGWTRGWPAAAGLAVVGAGLVIVGAVGT